MLTPYLICFPLSLVAANPVLQRIPIQIPTQTWPSQQCPTCPTQTCPNTSTPPPCQTCQNPYQNLFSSSPVIVRQPSNCPCNNPAPTQTSVANQIPPEILSQLVLRKFLSQQPQSQNAANQIQSPAAPVKCNQCEANKPVPNIINNYIIIPPEYFKSNDTKVNDEDTVKKRKGKRRRQQSQQRKQENDVACVCDENKDEHPDRVINIHNETCTCDKDALKSVLITEVRKDDSKNNSKSVTKIVNDKILPENVPADATRVSQNDKKILRCDEEEQCNKKIDNKNYEKPRRRSRERTKNLEEAIIKDFCKKHPTIPEEIARSLLKKLKQQVESRHSSHREPYPYSPFGYSEFCPPMFYPPYQDSRIQSARIKSDRTSRRRKPNRSPRRYKKPKEDLKENANDCDKKCEKLVELNPKVIDIETETITTEKIIATAENSHKNSFLKKESETQMENPSDLIEQLEQMKAKFAKLNEIETTTVNHNKYTEVYPDLGKEDTVPTVYDNGVDDYYPDFRGDNIALFTSDEERDLKDRYHYTTDRNGIDNKKHKFNKESNIHDLHSNSGKDENKSIEETKNESEEIRFKIPPSLELPDFKTKQINRFLALDDFETVKSYSNANADFIPEVEMKPAKVFTKDKTGRTNVETVFGRSRVVKYGQDSEGAGSDPVITYYLPEEAMTEERILLPDGEKAVVVAKSIHDLVEDWE